MSKKSFYNSLKYTGVFKIDKIPSLESKIKNLKKKIINKKDKKNNISNPLMFFNNKENNDRASNIGKNNKK